MSSVVAALPVLLRSWIAHEGRNTLTGRGRRRSDRAAGRFTRGDIDQLVRGAWAKGADQRAALPEEPTLGSRQNVVLAALTLALLNQLTQSGVARDYAIELTGDVCWRIYRRWGQAAGLLAHVVSRDPPRPLIFSVGTFLRYPINRLGYRYTDVAVADGRGLDMHRCPVTDYLGARGASDLCVGTWCNLDFALAQQWDATPQRSGTLAAGSPSCDFRFHATPGHRS